MAEVSFWRRINAHRDHRWAQPKLSEYVDGELPDRQQRRLAAHERICPECGRAIRTLQRMLGALRGMGPTRPGAPSVADRTAREVRRAIESDSPPPD